MKGGGGGSYKAGSTLYIYSIFLLQNTNVSIKTPFIMYYLLICVIHVINVIYPFPDVMDSSQVIPDVMDSSQVIPDVMDSSRVIPDVMDSSRVIPDVMDSSQARSDIMDSSQARSDSSEAILQSSRSGASKRKGRPHRKLRVVNGGRHASQSESSLNGGDVIQGRYTAVPALYNTSDYGTPLF